MLRKYSLTTMVILFLLFLLMMFNCFIIVNIDGATARNPGVFLFLGVIIMLITTHLFKITDKIKIIIKTHQNIRFQRSKIIFKYLMLFSLKSIFFFFISFILMFANEQTNSYILSKDGSYYYEYFPTCMVPDSMYECYNETITEDKNFYKVYKYLPFIGVPISAKEFYKVKESSKIIFNGCGY